MRTTLFPDSRGHRRAFTLIELLVVIAIIALLAALLLPALARARNKVRMVEELSAGRQLMFGVQLYADDRHGAVFPGYVTDLGVVDNRGERLSFPENARYPWRIAPYLSGSMPLIYSGKNRAKLAELQAQAHRDYVYGVSVFPSLGINSYFLGGNETEFPAAAANARFGAGTVVTRMEQVRRPSELMMFISARSAVSGEGAQGYYHVTPPYLRTRRWAANYSASLAPNQWGFVAPRFSNRAVAAPGNRCLQPRLDRAWRWWRMRASSIASAASFMWRADGNSPAARTNPCGQATLSGWI
jgi:prepilin-type N-terminal cleavage/methylation domain-containing protein